MCTVRDDDNALLDGKGTVSAGATCMKCHQRSPVVVIRINDPFCSECFLQYCTHKFRSAFGKSRLIRDGEAVLVAFCGDSSSSALVHLVQEGLSKRAQKKLRFHPTLVFIDECSVVGLNGSEREEARERVISQMRETGLPYHVYKLHQVFACQHNVEDVSESELTDVSANLAHMQVTNADQEMTPCASCSEPSAGELEQKLKAAMAAASTHTAKEGLLALFRNRLLVDIARELSFSKLLLAHSATHLAVRMLADITEGRGAHLAYQMNFADSRRQDVTLVRPMREFSAKEIAVYNRLNNVTPVFIPKLSTKQAGHSLDSLTEQFVLTLHAKSATTVNTICRTGEKLGLAKSWGEAEGGSSQSHCSMCEAPLDTLVGDSSALASTRFSQSMCQQKTQGTLQKETPGEDCHISNFQVVPNDSHTSSLPSACHVYFLSTCDMLTEDSTSSGMVKDFEQGFCYGCLRLIRDLADVSKLPDTMTGRTSADMSQQQMKQHIDEFLLEDSGQVAAAI